MQTQSPKIRLSESDHKKLEELVMQLPPNLRARAEELEDELLRAEVVAEKELPQDRVSMNSTLVYEDLFTGQSRTVQLSYPQDADVTQGRISILAPVGTALLGLQIGQTIVWPMPNGRVGSFRVKKVTQQANKEASEFKPESAS